MHGPAKDTGRDARGPCQPQLSPCRGVVGAGALLTLPWRAACGDRLEWEARHGREKGRPHWLLMETVFHASCFEVPDSFEPGSMADISYTVPSSRWRH